MKCPACFNGLTGFKFGGVAVDSCEGIKLKRHFFSAKRQIEVDLCPNCGPWLDEGELKKIRTEKTVSATAAEASGAGLSMEAIRFLYRQKLEQRPPL